MIQVLVQALCWTLLHSLWEGLVAAVLAGAVVLVTKRHSAVLRYTLLTTVFFGMTVAFAGTFVYELNRNARPTQAVTSSTEAVRSAVDDIQRGFRDGFRDGARTVPAYPAQQTGPAAPIVELGAPGQSPLSIVISAFDRAASATGAFCSTHALAIVALWTLVLLFKLTQMGAGLGYIHRIRRYKTTAPPEWWAQKVRELGAGIGLRRSISLLESALIDTPMVIGFLKPVILVPLGILTRLPQDQLEAVLLHELAHIRRKDYLVNLLQNLTETLFFFNPAVLWISSLIREERENCCDDVAIRKAQSKAQLIHALVAFQEFRVETPAYAQAFPGRQNQLLDRVRRMVYNRNKTLNAMEKLFLAACLLVAGAGTLAFSPVYRTQGADHRQSKSTLPVVSLNTLIHAGNGTNTAAGWGDDTTLTDDQNSSASDMVIISDTIPPPVPPVPPVAPVAPAGPVAPVAPVSPVAPVGPVAPVAPTAPVAPVGPVSPVAPVSPAAPVAPVAPVGPVSPVAPVAPVPPVPPAFSDDYVSTPFPEDELQGGVFEGSIEQRNHQIIRIDGIWKKGNVTRYYADGYRITKENGVITKLIIGTDRIPDGEISQHKDEVNTLIGQLIKRNQQQRAIAAQSQKLAAQNQARAMEAREAAEAQAVQAHIRYAQASQAQVQEARTQAISAQAQVREAQAQVQEAQTQAQAQAAESQARVSEAYSQAATSYAQSAPNDNAYSATSQTTTAPRTSEITVTGYGSPTPAPAALQTGTDPNHLIIEDILKGNLASDPNHLTFRLNRKSFSINGVSQDKETTDRFIKKYVFGKDDTYMSYAYMKKDGQTSSSVSTTRK